MCNAVLTTHYMVWSEEQTFQKLGIKAVVSPGLHALALHLTWWDEDDKGLPETNNGIGLETSTHTIASKLDKTMHNKHKPMV